MDNNERINNPQMLTVSQMVPPGLCQQPSPQEPWQQPQEGPASPHFTGEKSEAGRTQHPPRDTQPVLSPDIRCQASHCPVQQEPGSAGPGQPNETNHTKHQKQTNHDSWVCLQAIGLCIFLSASVSPSPSRAGHQAVSQSRGTRAGSLTGAPGKGARTPVATALADLVPAGPAHPCSFPLVSC